MLSAYAKAAVKLVPLVGGGDTLPDDELSTSASIERDHLTEYQRVCGFGISDKVPATYPHMFAFPLSMDLMTRLSFPFGVIGLVHVENEIEQVRPIGVDERLDLRVRTADLREHERGRQFDVLATAESAGETVWRSRSTYLRIEKSGSGGADKRAEAPQASAIWTVPGDQGRRYASVSGDSNPIHLHPLTARLFGFPRPIAHGMWVKARCLAALEGHLPGSFVVNVRFKLPMLLPAKAAFSRNGGEFAVHDARSGKPHVAGTVT